MYDTCNFSSIVQLCRLIGHAHLLLLLLPWFACWSCFFKPYVDFFFLMFSTSPLVYPLLTTRSDLFSFPTASLYALAPSHQARISRFKGRVRNDVLTQMELLFLLQLAAHCSAPNVVKNCASPTFLGSERGKSAFLAVSWRG